MNDLIKMIDNWLDEPNDDQGLALESAVDLLTIIRARLVAANRTKAEAETPSVFCAVCGSADVECLDWMNSNTLKYVGGNDDGYEDHLYCPACHMHTDQVPWEDLSDELRAKVPNPCEHGDDIDWVCAECGSTKVERAVIDADNGQLVWVDPRTGVVYGPALEGSVVGDGFCRQCEVHGELITRDEWAARISTVDPSGEGDNPAPATGATRSPSEDGACSRGSHEHGGA